MLDHNSLLLCLRKLALVSKDSPFNVLSNGILSLGISSTQAEIGISQNRYLIIAKTQMQQKKANLGDFYNFLPRRFFRTFFLSMRTYSGNKISWVCICCNLREVDPIFLPKCLYFINVNILSFISTSLYGTALF